MLTFALLAPLLAQEVPTEYEPTWESLATHPTPTWFADAKFGIFIHWGVYSVPSYCDTSTYSEWYQHWYDTNSHGGKVREFHDKWYGADFEYREFAPLFKAELFDPKEWAEIFKRAGAKYMVLTSKHHDGYCLWPSEVASEVRGYPWDSTTTGPQRDLVGELLGACREAGVRPGLYYSFMEWHSPLYPSDIPKYVDTVAFPQIRELITRYQPDVFWPDGEWDHPDTLWRAPEMLEWIYENAPNSADLAVNDRWGRGLRGRVGDYSTTEYGNLGNSSGEGMREERPFEECRGIGHPFAFNRAEGYDVYSSRTECVEMLVDLVSKGGNLLLDIGPDADGTIPLIMVDRLLAMGRWLETNGEAIYGTTRGALQGLPWGRSTTKGNTLYLHVFDWPEGDVLHVPGLSTEVRSVRYLGDRQGDRQLDFVPRAHAGLDIRLEGLHPDEHVSVLRLELAGPPEVDNRIYADADGVFVASADSAAIAGGTARLESRSDAQNIGYWSDTTSTVTWKFALQAGQRYRLELDTAVANGAEGGTLEVTLAGETRAIEISEPTGDWATFAWRSYGEWTATEGSQLRLRAADPGPIALMNIRKLRLVPLE